MTRTRSRSSFAIVLLLTPAMLPLQARAEDADTDILSEARILHDAAIPAAGNADGDITIIENFDYQCPYCRKISPDLAKEIIRRTDQFLIYANGGNDHEFDRQLAARLRMPHFRDWSKHVERTPADWERLYENERRWREAWGA